MTKILLTTLIPLYVFLCANVFAQNQSGLFADPDRSGEGAAIFEQERLNNDNVIQATVFTYMNRCNNRAFDSEGDLIDRLKDFTYTTNTGEGDVVIDLVDVVEGLAAYDHCREIQAWFITGNHPISGGQAVGPIYITEPFQDSALPLADVQDVGLFVIKEAGSGFSLEVLQTGRVLDEDSELYMRTYRWDYLFGPTLSAPEGVESPE